jgi:hypothetical protein
LIQLVSTPRASGYIAIMRCRSFSFGVLLALAAFWLATDVRIGGTSADAGGTIARVHGEATAIPSSHVGLGTVSAPRRTPPGEWGSRLFLSLHRVAGRVQAAAAPVASNDSRIRERERHTFTYDATAPPGETANTVL